MAKYLDLIESPQDLKKLKVEELPELAQEIRDELIQTLSKTGGHLGPNLGVVELTLAWHYVFDSPTDRLLMDVSHQSYVHKILTGRRSKMHTIRQYEGLNGFMLRTESPHDHFGAGHAGTALSAALGMATGRDLKGGHEHVTALCGDAAFTCGVTFEALNNAAHHTKKLIVILNDNEWSIDKNVGSIAAYLNKIVTSPTYEHLHESAEKFLERIGGQAAVRLAHKVEEGLKGLAWKQSTLFEEFGFTYYGPLDGHDLPTLVKTFEFFKHQNHPVLLHAITKKGKGFDLAMAKQKKFHGVGPNTYSPDGSETAASGLPTYSQVFGETLSALADKHDNVVGITGAMPNGTGLEIFQARHKDRYYDVGIAEEHAVIFAAGMATRGLKPFCAIYSTFMQRAFDPIVHDVCLQNLDVVLCMDRAGLSPDDGPTHHGVFDIAYLRPIPNIVLMQPKDEDEFVDMLYTAYEHKGPIAIRYSRGSGPGTKIKDKPATLPIGSWEPLRDGHDAVIFALGPMVQLAMEAAATLQQQGISCAVVNARFIKPLDTQTLTSFASKSKVICTMEDHVLSGGFGSAVMEALNASGIHKPVAMIGWSDQFVEHGNLKVLRENGGITASNTVQKITQLLAQSSGKY